MDLPTWLWTHSIIFVLLPIMRIKSETNLSIHQTVHYKGIREALREHPLSQISILSPTASISSSNPQTTLSEAHK